MTNHYGSDRYVPEAKTKERLVAHTIWLLSLKTFGGFWSAFAARDIMSEHYSLDELDQIQDAYLHGYEVLIDRQSENYKYYCFTNPVGELRTFLPVFYERMAHIDPYSPDCLVLDAAWRTMLRNARLALSLSNPDGEETIKASADAIRAGVPAEDIFV